MEIKSIVTFRTISRRDKTKYRGAPNDEQTGVTNFILVNKSWPRASNKRVRAARK